MTQSSPPLSLHAPLFEEDDDEEEERAGLIRSSIYSNPPMVVGAHYCNPNQETNLTLALKVPFFKSDRLVDKPTGNTVFTIKSKAFSLRNNFVLLNAAGNPVLCARSKVQRKSTFLGKIAFVIKLFPGADQAFIITLILIIEEIVKERTQVAAAAAAAT